MRILLQDGFGKHLLILWLAAALLTTGVAWAGARLAGAYLAGTVDETLGSAGTYDAILHWRSETVPQSLTQAEKLLREAYPGVGLHRGPEVVGNANLFVALPEDARTGEALEGLPGIVREVTGYNGITYMVEPSVDLAGVAEGLEDELAAQVEAIPGVAFAFRHGSTITAVLEEAGQLQTVTQHLEDLVADQNLVELRLPQAGEGDPQVVADRLTARAGVALQPVVAGERVPADLDGALARLRQLLPLLREETGLKAAWRETAQELRGLAQAVGEGQAAAQAAAQAGAETMVQLQTALHQVESLQTRVDQLAQDLASPEGRGSTLSLLAQMLVENLAGGTAQAAPRETEPGDGSRDQDPLAAVEDLDLEGLASLQGELETLQASLGGMDAAALEAAAAQVEATVDGLPALTDAEVEQLAGLLAQWGGESGPTGERLAFLVSGPVDAGALAEAARAELDDPEAAVAVVPAATVRPTARASLMQMLHQARGLVAGLLVVVVGGAHLFLDLSAVRSGAIALGRLRPGRALGRERRRWWTRVWDEGTRPDLTWILAMVWGGSLVAVAYGLSGAELPSVDGMVAFLAGAALALAAWALAGRINPTRTEEVELAVAAGLTPVQVMEAVVVPEARPSLLGLLARKGRLLEGPEVSKPPLWTAIGKRLAGRGRSHGGKR